MGSRTVLTDAFEIAIVSPRVFDLIRWMRNDAKAKVIPIIVLSSSNLADDVNLAYALGANAYMVKHPNPRAFERLFRTTPSSGIWARRPDYNWSRNPDTTPKP